MNPIAKMMKSCINMPLKKALPLLFIGALVLAATTGCIENRTTQNQSGGGSGKSDVAVKINSESNVTQLGSGYLVSTPNAGYKFVIFNVTVTNLNEESWTMGSPYDFKLTTADGTAYEVTSSTYLGGDSIKSVSNTAPGEKVTGMIAFEVPQSAKLAKLTYSDYSNEVVTNLS